MLLKWIEIFLSNCYAIPYLETSWSTFSLRTKLVTGSRSDLTGTVKRRIMTFLDLLVMTWMFLVFFARAHCRLMPSFPSTSISPPFSAQTPTPFRIAAIEWSFHFGVTCKLGEGTPHKLLQLPALWVEVPYSLSWPSQRQLYDKVKYLQWINIRFFVAYRTFWEMLLWFFLFKNSQKTKQEAKYEGEFSIKYKISVSYSFPVSTSSSNTPIFILNTKEAICSQNTHKQSKPQVF